MPPPRVLLRPSVAVLLLSILLGASGVASPVQEKAASPAPSTGDARWCIVCEAEAAPGAITETWRGRRVTLCNEQCRAAFLERREELFASLQARGALFDEKATSERALFSGWFWLGIWALAGLICGAVAVYVAIGKGLAPLPWLLGALAFNGIALILLAARPRGDLSRLPQGVPAGLRKIPTTHAPAACAKCGRENHPSARVCARCGAPMEARIESESARALPGDGA